MPMKSLNNLEPGNTAVIRGFKGDSRLQSRLVEMGVLLGEKVRLIKKTPFQGPLEVKIRSYHLSLRPVPRVAGLQLDLGEVDEFLHLDNQTNPNWQTLGGVPINQVRDIAFPHWRLKINKIFGL